MNFGFRAKALTTVALAVALALSACGGNSPSGAASKSSGGGDLGKMTMAFPVELTLSTPNFVVAQGCGFWDQLGLKVDFLFGSSGTENIGAITSNRAQMSFLDMGNLGSLVDKGQKNLKVIYHWNPTNIFEVMALEKSGIKSAADLKGKKVGISGLGSVTRYLLQASLEQAGLKESDVNLVTVGATRVAALESGQIDALVGWDQIRKQIEGDGYKTVDLGLGKGKVVPSNMLITSDSVLSQRPDAVKAFVRGLNNATQWSVDHPDQAFDVVKKAMPAQTQKEDSAKVQVQTRLDSFKSYDTSKPFGDFDVAAWQSSADLLARLGAIPATFDVKNYVTKDYIPSAPDADLKCKQ